MTERGASAPFSRRTLWLIGSGAIALFGTIFMAGAYRGYNAHAAEPGWGWPLVAMAAAFAAAVLFGLWRAYRQPPTAPATGPGEAAEAAGKRRFWTILGTLFVVGGVVGAGAAAYETDAGGFMTGRLPPAFAIAAAIVTTLALVIGTVLFYRRIDEVERSDNIWAGAIAANLLMIGYPSWFFLWRGGIIGEPSHLVLIALLYGVTVAAYFYRKFR